jgi:hypothetical protein
MKNNNNLPGEHPEAYTLPLKEDENLGIKEVINNIDADINTAINTDNHETAYVHVDAQLPDKNQHAKVYVRAKNYPLQSSPVIVLNSHNIHLYVQRLGEIMAQHPQIHLDAELSEQELQQIFAQLLGFKSWELLHNLLKKQALKAPELSSEQSMSRLLQLTLPKIVQKPEQLTHRQGDNLKLKKPCTLFEALNDKRILKYPLRWQNVEVFASELCSGDYFLPLMLLKIWENPVNKSLNVFQHYYVYVCPRSFLGYSVDYDKNNLQDNAQFIKAFIKIIQATRQKTEHGSIYNLAVYGKEIEKIMDLLHILSDLHIKEKSQEK